MPTAPPVTRLLLEWKGGSDAALQQLTPLVYKELRKLAAGSLARERPGHTLQPTALVHEAFIRLVEQDHQNWQSRAHFFGVAAHLMRLILVDWARKSRAGKRGGGAHQVTLEDIATQRPEQLIALDDALKELEEMDPRKSKVIELRYFGGMTADETAESLGISKPTVERDTRVAQLWLNRQMKGGARA